MKHRETDNKAQHFRMKQSSGLLYFKVELSLI